MMHRAIDPSPRPPRVAIALLAGLGVGHGTALVAAGLLEGVAGSVTSVVGFVFALGLVLATAPRPWTHRLRRVGSLAAALGVLVTALLERDTGLGVVGALLFTTLGLPVVAAAAVDGRAGAFALGFAATVFVALWGAMQALDFHLFGARELAFVYLVADVAIAALFLVGARAAGITRAAR